MVEGVTEKMLLPIMINKEAKSLNNEYISVLEVGGNYTHKFKELLHFIKVKTLIITDLDTVGLDDKKCEPSIGVSYSNDALSFFFKNPTLLDLKVFTIQNKTFKLCQKYQYAD